MGCQLTEKHASSRCEVLWLNSALNRNHGKLEGSAPTGASHNLVADPCASGGVNVEEEEQAGADSGYSATADEKRLVVTGGSDDEATSNGRYGNGNDEWQVANATHGW